MDISVEKVKELREKTAIGMMACKKALVETEGDMEKAIDNLRKQGQATAAKRAGKSTKEGKIGVRIGSDAAVMYEVNSETDFVARNEDFVSFADTLGDILLKQQPGSIEEAKTLKAVEFGQQTIEAKLIELTGKIGELITFRRFTVMELDAATQKIFHYIHGGGKIGVIVKCTPKKADVLDDEQLAALGKDIAMQIAASNPCAIRREHIDSETVEKEKEIYLTQAQSSGKPEKIWDKIVTGKLEKFYKEITLLEQEFIKNTDNTVAERIKETEKQLDTPIDISAFVRYELGSEA
jgi:elongation factor Ts